MTRYYVYNAKSPEDDQRFHMFVEDPKIFALKVFDPPNMEFSGVFVEAEDAHAAQRVYVHPQENDVLVSCDEPHPTVLKRIAFESRVRLAKKQLVETQEAMEPSELDARRARIRGLAFELGMHFNLMASQVSELARQLRATSSPEDRQIFSNEQIYARLITQYAQQLLQLKYRPGLDGKVQG